MRALLAQHASALAEDAPALSGGAFDALVIDDDVPAHLSSRDVFSGYSVPVFEEGEEEGAMGVGPAGAPAQANASSAGVSADGLASADVDAAPPAPSLPPWCVEAHPPFWTSTYGARGVLFHDGSPARLVSALFARLGDEHPWDDGAGGAEGAAAQWRPILAPAPLQPGVGVGRWLMATLYSAAGGRLWGTTPERPNGGHVTSSAGAPHGKAPPRRVVLRLSASCAADQPPRADQAVSAATAAHLRRARHIFTASRCVQVLRGAPAADASTSGWEEACADVWSGPLLP